MQLTQLSSRVPPEYGERARERVAGAAPAGYPGEETRRQLGSWVRICAGRRVCGHYRDCLVSQHHSRWIPTPPRLRRPQEG